MKTIWIINQYASTPETGMGGRSYYLAQELAKQGFRVYLVASTANHLLREKPAVVGSFTLKIQKKITFVWVKMPEYENSHSKQRVFNWFLFAWRIKTLRKIISHKPDVILCSSPSPVAFLGAQYLAKKCKAKLVFEVRDIWPLTLTEIGNFSKKHPFILLLQWIEDRAYRYSDRVVSNLKNSVEHMIARGMETEKFAWIPNGFSRDEFSSVKPLDADVLRELPRNKFIVGYTGTFGLANDLYTLLDAASQLRQYQEINFVLVGGGKEKLELVDYSNKLGLASVFFIDAIGKKQIPTMLAHFDVLAVGAKKEPMYRFGVSPNKLFEYLIASKPIIYYIDSGNYHPIEDAQCGLEVEPGNSALLADAILKLYRLSDDDRAVMGSNGHRLALQEYDYAELAKKLSHILFSN